ncbi:MAG: c-type cytochrome [Anaerolineae bacterium]|nr:c-type cytochrome [Anaerolineae bacterium]
MKKILKWIGLIVGVLVVLLVVLVGGLHFLGSSRLAQAPAVAVTPLDIPTDEAALARGQHLAEVVSLCSDCHTENFGGQVFIDEAPIGVVTAPNLTSGQGGVGASYTDEDWVRAIRHGIGADGRTLVTMPSNAFAHLSDEDLGALIAYLKTVPPADNDLPERAIMFPGTIIFGVLGYGSMPVSLIDHSAVASVSAPPEGVTAEYGGYLAEIGGCTECHGANLAGLTDPNGPPPGPNLTPGGELAGWSEADFFTTIRTGTTPSGRNLDPEQMPWPWIARMTDDELSAIWQFLQSLPARELGDNG